MHLTDKARIEFALPARIMFDVVAAGADEPDGEEAKRVRDLLRLAAAEPFDDLPERKRKALMRRTERLFESVMHEHRAEGALVAKAGLVWFYALRMIVEQEFLVLHEAGAMARALEVLLPALQRAADQPALDRSARRQATKLLQRLQWLGFYEGVALEQQAA